MILEHWMSIIESIESQFKSDYCNYEKNMDQGPQHKMLLKKCKDYVKKSSVSFSNEYNSLVINWETFLNN